MCPKTVAGLLEKIGINIHGSKTRKTQQISLIAFAINPIYDVIAIANIAGNTYDGDVERIVNHFSKKLSLNLQFKGIQLSEPEIIKLSEELFKKHFQIAVTTIDIQNIEFRLKSPRDIFNNSLILKIDNILDLRKRIKEGKWKTLVFYTPSSRYYIFLSKLRKNKFSINLRTKTFLPNKFIKVLDDILPVIKFIKGVSKAKGNNTEKKEAISLILDNYEKIPQQEAEDLLINLIEPSQDEDIRILTAQLILRKKTKITHGFYLKIISKLFNDPSEQVKTLIMEDPFVKEITESVKKAFESFKVLVSLLNKHIAKLRY